MSSFLWQLLTFYCLQCTEMWYMFSHTFYVLTMLFNSLKVHLYEIEEAEV